MENVKKTYDMHIDAQRISLRVICPTLENAQMVQNIIYQNGGHLERFFYMLSYEMPTSEVAQAVLADALENHVLGKSLHYGIFYKDYLIGGLRALEMHNPQEKELEYWLIKKAQGYGLMSEALNAFEKRYFEGNWGESLCALVSRDANRSRILLERNGYNLEHENRYVKTKQMYNNIDVCWNRFSKKVYGKEREA